MKYVFRYNGLQTEDISRNTHIVWNRKKFTAGEVGYFVYTVLKAFMRCEERKSLPLNNTTCIPQAAGFCVHFQA